MKGGRGKIAVEFFFLFFYLFLHGRMGRVTCWRVQKNEKAKVDERCASKFLFCPISPKKVNNKERKLFFSVCFFFFFFLGGGCGRGGSIFFFFVCVMSKEKKKRV